MSKTTGPISAFLRHHFRHFNAAALIDGADGYRTHLAKYEAPPNPSAARALIAA